MNERGLSVDHTTTWRWVQRYAPEVNRRMRPHLRMSGTSYRINETSVLHHLHIWRGWKFFATLPPTLTSADDFVTSRPARPDARC